MKLVDIVNSSRLDNKLLNVPTKVSENGNNVVIFDDGLVELGSKSGILQFGLRDVIAENDVFYFKFQDKGGIKESVNGISALASSIGKLVIMDEITTKMCVTRVGRIGFAIVLVELDVEYGIKDKIEIMYKSKNVAEGTKKIVDVEYSWIPCICSHCKVFGHTDSYCKIKSKNVIDDSSVKANENEFKVVKRKEDEGKGQDVIVNMGKDIEANEGSTSVENSNRKGMLGFNRFTLLDSLINEEELVPNTDQRKIVDEFLSKKNDANNMEMNGWNEDMKMYYRDKKELFDAA
ncbi:RNA-directed DNA polymerase, eukaryota, reverse transcriptase zinc-binding domain protein [Tanacetum coccineum]